MKPIRVAVIVVLWMMMIAPQARASIQADVKLVPGISFRKELKNLNSIEYASAFAKGSASVLSAPVGELCNGQNPCPSQIHIRKIYNCNGDNCIPVKGTYEGRSPY